MKFTTVLLCALAVTAVVAQEESSGEYEYEYEYNMWIPCEGQKKFFEPDCPCRPGIDPECDIPDIPCEEHYVRDCNDRCSPAFWIGNGQCDDTSEKQAKRIQKQNKGPMYSNFNCETFWYDGGDCDLVDHMGRPKNVDLQMVKDTMSSAPAMAVGVVAVVALVAAKLRRNTHQEL